MHMCDMQTHRALESPPTQLTVNQAVGVAVNAAAAAAAVQPGKVSHTRYLVNAAAAAAAAAVQPPKASNARYLVTLSALPSRRCQYWH
jgi:hypothetical protein